MTETGSTNRDLLDELRSPAPSTAVPSTAVPSTAASVDAVDAAAAPATVDSVAPTGSGAGPDVHAGSVDGRAMGSNAEVARPGPAVLITDHQTAGRGTKGRSWFDPPGGSLLMSVRLFPHLPPSQLHLFTMALSLAAAGACAEVAGVEVGLKWPNDLFVQDRKLAGVLAESSVRGGRVEALVIGIGMNVNWPPEVPAELADTAVALNQLAGADVDRVALAQAAIRNLEAQLTLLESPGGPDRLLARYRACSVTLGRQVRVELPDAPLLGTAVDIANDGQLIVEIDGFRRHFAAADITHLRLA